MSKHKKLFVYPDFTQYEIPIKPNVRVHEVFECADTEENSTV